MRKDVISDYGLEGSGPVFSTIQLYHLIGYQNQCVSEVAFRGKRKSLSLTIILLVCSIIYVLSTKSVEAADQNLKKFLVPPPPFTPGIFPCSQCHKDMPVNRKPRKLELMHQEINLRHMPGGWCFDCHNPDDRDKLRLANGTLISFEESYNLCGQCHGTILREWKAGLHGKRIGYWNGEKQYFLCVHCHWPHEPAFKPITPMPPPVRPSDIR